MHPEGISKTIKCSTPDTETTQLLLASILLTFLFLFPWVPGFTQSRQANPKDIPQINEPITLDAHLDESAWKRAQRFPLNYEIAPGENTTPPVKTHALMMYSQTHLYVAFKAGVEKNTAVQGHLMDRDDLNNISQEDIVGMRIDPFNDARRAFEFLVNPLGVQFDAIFQDQQNREDFSWDALWNSRGRITSDGYIVELAIPFESLRFPRSNDRQTWRIAFVRVYPADARHQIINIPLDYDNSSFLEQVPEVTGFTDITRSTSLDLTPTITSRKTDRRPAPGGELEPGRITVEPGLTATWDVTSNLTISGTANPDFSQVEADAAQLQENARFVLSYPEKRPFFVEGSELFETPMQAVFTRSILEPIGGTKLAGKMGHNVLGVFSTLDRKNSLVFPSNQNSTRKTLDRNVWTNVFRYQRDIGKNSNLGMLYNGREAQNYHNRLAGFDGFTRFWGSNSLEVQYLRSFTNYARDIQSEFNQPGGTFQGDAISAELDHSSRRWFGEIAYKQISPGFRGDGGFFPRADFRTQEIEAGHIIRGDSDRWFNRIRLSGSMERTTDFEGTLTDRQWEIEADYSGPMRSSGETALSFTQRRFKNTEYNLTSLSLYGAIQLSGSTRFDSYASFGEEIDFTNNRKANELLVHPDLSLRIGRNISVNIDPIYQRLETLEGERIFTTWLINGRILYHFNVNTFVRGLFRYRHVNRNTSVYRDPVSKQNQSLFGQFLFNYKLNPRSVLFLGITHHFGDAPDPNDIVLQNRTTFMKVGYVFQL